jgi:dephospho-CoA kinase
MKTFGLTGGIASGKSTVAKRFRERGLDVLDADQVAREVVAAGTPGLLEVKKAFGEDVIANGELDRKALGRMIFADSALRMKLNAIVHPRIAEKTQAHFAALAGRGTAIACYEVPLLFESKLEEGLRPVVLVAIPYPIQLERLMLRDGSSKAEAEARIASQGSLEDKRKRADFVIENDGSKAELQMRADETLNALCQSLGLPLFL